MNIIVLGGRYAWSVATLCDPQGMYSPSGSSVHGIFQQEYWSGLLFFFLQGVFLTQEFNPSLLHLLHWQADSLPLPYLLLNVNC